MEAIQLFKDNFDSLENHSPHHSELLGTFIAGNGLSAHGKVNEFINSLEPFNVYLGYDGNVYPKLRLVKIEIN